MGSSSQLILRWRSAARTLKDGGYEAFSPRASTLYSLQLVSPWCARWVQCLSVLGPLAITLQMAVEARMQAQWSFAGVALESPGSAMTAFLPKCLGAWQPPSQEQSKASLGQSSSQ